MRLKLSLLAVAPALCLAAEEGAAAPAVNNFVTFASLQPFIRSKFSESDMQGYVDTVVGGFDSHLAGASENCRNDIAGMFSTDQQGRDSSVHAMTALVVQMGMLSFDYAKDAGEKTDGEQLKALEVFTNVCNTMRLPRNGTNVSSTGAAVCLEINDVETNWCIPEACVEVAFLPSMAGIKGVSVGDMTMLPQMLGCNPDMQNVSAAARVVLTQNIATNEFATAGTTLPLLATCTIDACSTTSREIVVIVIFSFIGLLCALTIKGLWKARVCKDCSKASYSKAEPAKDSSAQPLQGNAGP